MRSLLGVALILLVSCGSNGGEPVGTPQLDLESFGAEFRNRLEPRWRRVQSSPDDSSASGELAMLLHAGKSYEKAIAFYERAVLLAPDEFRWRYLLAAALAETGRHAEAAEKSREALALRSEAVPARLLLADSVLALNQLPEAQQLYEAVIAGNSGIAAAQYGLGQALRAQGKASEAVAALRTACDLAPEAGAAHYALAQAYRATGDDAKASEHLAIYEGGNRNLPFLDDPTMEGVRQLARDQHWHLNEGRRLDAAGRRRQAITHYEQAVAIAPDFYQAHVNLLGAYTMLGNPAKAEHHYRRAVEINPSVAELHYNWGVFEASRNRHAEAARAFRQALEVNPQFADAHQNLGTALERQGFARKAAEHYRRALFHDPKQRLAHFHLGRYLVDQGEVAEGIRHLEQAAEREDLRSPAIHYALSMAYVRANDAANALEHAETAHTLARQYGQHDFAASIESDIASLTQLRDGR